MRDNLPAWLRRSLVTRNVCLEAAQMIEEQAGEIRKLTAERDDLLRRVAAINEIQRARDEAALSDALVAHARRVWGA